MKCLKRYKNKDKARAYRNKDRERNYKNGRFYQTKQSMWFPREVAILYIRDQQGTMSDRDIAKELGRSVQSVQGKRYQLSIKGNPISQSVQIILDYFLEHGL